MQNTSPVFSAPASATDLAPFRRVKLTALGAAYAGVGETAVGTLLPGDPGGDLTAAIQGLEFGLHFAVMGNATDIVAGDEIEAFADGKVVKRTTGAAIGVALDGGSDADDVIRVRYYPVNGFKVVAAGVHTWAGGATTNDSIAVPGLLVTDIVIGTLVLRSGAQQLSLAANDAGNDQIDLTLSAAGVNGGEKIAWAVLRA